MVSLTARGGNFWFYGTAAVTAFLGKSEKYLMCWLFFVGKKWVDEAQAPLFAILKTKAGLNDICSWF